MAEETVHQELTPAVEESERRSDSPTLELALPEAELPQPPRPLVPGAFLSGEFEIKELIARGVVNFYIAHGGDYMQPSPFLVAERELIENEQVQESVEQSTHAEDGTPENAIEETESDIIAALGDDQSALASQSSNDIALQAGPRESLQSPLFARGKNFVQDGREYLICPWQETQTLQDWREPTNDARYLRVISRLLSGLQELEAKQLTAALSRETLRFDEGGDLKFFGFVDDQPTDGQLPTSALASLHEINGFLLKHVFAESATMRLDDEWSGLALTEEVKSFATRLLNNEFASLQDIIQALPSLPDGVLDADAVLLTDVGQEREINEDSGLIFKIARVGHHRNLDVELYAVSDGMGGHEGGEVASDMTLKALQHAVLARVDAGLNWNDNVAVRSELWQIIDEVNAAVLTLTDEPKYRSLRNKPGATLVFALRVGSTLFIGNVGDSRAYRWNHQGLQRLTKDHSYVQTLIDSGQLKPEEAWGHPDGSVITAHIGMSKLRQKDIFLRLVQPGDNIALVTDGVIDMLRDEQIAEFLKEGAPSDVCKNLVDASNVAGGFDNITIICITFH